MMKFQEFERMIVEYEMDFFRTYLNEMEQTLREKNTDLEQKWKASERERDPSEYQDYLIDRNDKLQRHFGIFYSSFIIAIFNFLEHELDGVCRTFSIKDKSKITLKDIRGRGIRRAKIFIEKICNLDLPSENLWQELEGMNEVRNCLVHSNGEINEENKNLLSYVKKSEKIKIEENRTKKIKTIKITKEYCFFVIKIVEEYLLTLINKNVENVKNEWEE